jgi:glycosyltransferase involved in cell wall biosynthesis
MPLENFLDECFLTIQPSPSVSAIVCCKNRSENLFISLESWLKIKQITEIIILDFGSDTVLRLPFNDSRIKLYRYESVYWHLSKAYNIAIQLSTKNIILKLDCDYYLNPNFLVSNKLSSNEFIVGKNGNSTRGLLFTHKKNFFSINGYNERIINWGGDDTDIYRRLIKFGLKEKIVIPNTIKHLPHKENLRTKYVPNPAINRHSSGRKNIVEGINNPWTLLDKMSSYYD